MRINVGSHQTSVYIVCRVHALKSILEYQSSNHHGIECPGYSWSIENNSKITIYIQPVSVYIHIDIYHNITSNYQLSWNSHAHHILDNFWFDFLKSRAISKAHHLINPFTVGMRHPLTPRHPSKRLKMSEPDIWQAIPWSWNIDIFNVFVFIKTKCTTLTSHNPTMNQTLVALSAWNLGAMKFTFKLWLTCQFGRSSRDWILTGKCQCVGVIGW